MRIALWYRLNAKRCDNVRPESKRHRWMYTVIALSTILAPIIPRSIQVAGFSGAAFAAEKSADQLLEEFNAEARKERPDFAKLDEIRKAMARKDRTMAGELGKAIEDRGKTVGRRLVPTIEAALNADRMDAARRDLTYANANRNYLELSFDKLVVLERRSQAVSEAESKTAQVRESLEAIKTSLTENKIGEAYRIHRVADQRLEGIKGNLEGRVYTDLRDGLDRAEKAIKEEEKELLAEAMRVLRQEGPEAAISFRKSTLIEAGVPREHLNKLDEAIVDEERAKQARADSIKAAEAERRYQEAIARQEREKARRDSIAAWEEKQERLAKLQRKREKRLQRKREKARRDSIRAAERERERQAKLEEERREREQRLKREREEARRDSIEAVREQQRRQARLEQERREEERRRKERLEQQRREEEQRRAEQERRQREREEQLKREREQARLDSIEQAREEQRRARLKQQQREEEQRRAALERREREQQERLDRERREQQRLQEQQQEQELSRREERERKAELERRKRQLQEELERKRQAARRDSIEAARELRNRQARLEQERLEEQRRREQQRREEEARREREREERLKRERERARQERIEADRLRRQQQAQREQQSIEEQRRRDQQRRAREIADTRRAHAERRRTEPKPTPPSRPRAAQASRKNEPREKANATLEEIYFLLEKGETKLAYLRFEMERNRLRRDLYGEAYKVLKQTVDQAYAEELKGRGQARAGAGQREATPTFYASTPAPPSNRKKLSDEQTYINLIQAHLNRNKIPEAHRVFERHKREIKRYMNRKDFKVLRGRVTNAYKYYEQARK